MGPQTEVKSKKERKNIITTLPDLVKAESIERSLLLIGWAEEASLRGIFKLR